MEKDKEKIAVCEKFCSTIKPLEVGYLSKFGFKQTNPHVKRPQYKQCAVKNLVGISKKDRVIQPPKIYSLKVKSNILIRKGDDTKKTKVNVKSKKRESLKLKPIRSKSKIDSNSCWNNNKSKSLLPYNKNSKRQKQSILSINKKYSKVSQNYIPKKDVLRKKLKNIYIPKNSGLKNKNVLKASTKNKKQLNSKDFSIRKITKTKQKLTRKGITMSTTKSNRLKSTRVKAKEKEIKEQKRAKQIKILNTKKDALTVALKNQRKKIEAINFTNQNLQRLIEETQKKIQKTTLKYLNTKNDLIITLNRYLDLKYKLDEVDVTSTFKDYEYERNHVLAIIEKVVEKEEAVLNWSRVDHEVTEKCKEKKEEEKDALLTECENIRTKLYKF